MDKQFGVKKKRLAPKAVIPLIHNNIEYSAGQQIGMALVQAKNISTNTILWTRAAYSVNYDHHKERDVQDVWITKIELADDLKNLKITNEKKQIFTMPLQ